MYRDVEKFKGIFVAMYSAYGEDGSVSRDRVRALTRYYINAGVKGLYVGGSSGEGLLQNEQERRETLEAVMAEARGEITIIAHVGANSTVESVRLAEHAESLGVDAISSIPCVYYGFSPEAVKRHWNAMIDATSLPFIIYHIPQTTRFNLPITLFEEMVQNEKVIGIKCSSESTYELERFKHIGDRIKQGDFIVFNGPDEQFVAGRIIGADSGIGGTYGVMPELFIKLNELMEQEHLKQARHLQDEVNDIIKDLLNGPSLYGMTKYILHLRGVETGDPRGPMLPVETEEHKTLCREINTRIEETILKYCK